MSATNYKKPFHRRNDSGELDVFEATDYFSGYNDNCTLIGGANLAHKVVSKDERRGLLRDGRRVSLDVASLKHYYHSTIVEAQQHQLQQQQQQQQKPKEKKKYKQPSSPGGKIAQFLNSLFSQTNSKKKKTLKSLSSTQSMKDHEDESSIGRRKRRSSVSHFRSTSSAVDARSLYSNSSSGFRTPPPYNVNTPTKSCKDFRSFDDYKDVLATLSKYGNYGSSINGNNAKYDKVVHNFDWIDEKLRMVEKMKNNNNNNHGYLNQEKKENCKNFSHEDDECDGADSDSSSDLFELQIDCGFEFCSSGLPVYETTRMDNIKISSSPAITNCPIKA